MICFEQGQLINTKTREQMVIAEGCFSIHLKDDGEMILRDRHGNEYDGLEDAKTGKRLGSIREMIDSGDLQLIKIED